MTIAKLFASLTKQTARTASQLRADLDKIDLSVLEAKVAEVESERRSLLLRGTDADLERNAKALAAAKLEAERGQAAVDELTRLANEAEARETEEAFVAEYDAAVRAKASLDAALTAAETAVAQCRTHLDEATAAAAVLAKWNRGVDPAAQPDRRIPHTTVDSAKQRLMRIISAR